MNNEQVCKGCAGRGFVVDAANIPQTCAICKGTGKS